MEQNKKTTLLQKIILISFGLIIALDFLGYLDLAVKVLALENYRNLYYLLWILPIITYPFGLYGIYKIFKFKRMGFYLFYMAFAASTFVDLLRGIGTTGKLITLGGNLLFLTIFILPTLKIYRNSD